MIIHILLLMRFELKNADLNRNWDIEAADIIIGFVLNKICKRKLKIYKNMIK